ncbi:hypothetical protein T08_14357 [Trichinella sp. T8]|nr:hypothetical protein T08_14357 [Trichinella sp. T8]
MDVKARLQEALQQTSLFEIDAEGAQAYSGYSLKKRFEILQMGENFRLIRKRKTECDISHVHMHLMKYLTQLKHLMNGLVTAESGKRS